MARDPSEHIAELELLLQVSNTQCAKLEHRNLQLLTHIDNLESEKAALADKVNEDTILLSQFLMDVEGVLKSFNESGNNVMGILFSAHRLKSAGEVRVENEIRAHIEWMSEYLGDVINRTKDLWKN